MGVGFVVKPQDDFLSVGCASPGWDLGRKEWIPRPVQHFTFHDEKGRLHL
jgi:hypothetical protein